MADPSAGDGGSGEKKEKQKKHRARSGSVSDRISQAFKALAPKPKKSPRSSPRGTDSPHASDAEGSPRTAVALESDAEDGDPALDMVSSTRTEHALALPKERSKEHKRSYSSSAPKPPLPWETSAGVHSLSNIGLQVDDLSKDVKALKRLVETLSITMPRQIEAVQRHLDERDAGAQIAVARAAEDDCCAWCSFSCCCQ
jgi:hypothetical protein